LVLEQGDVVALKGGKIKSYLGVNSINMQHETVFWREPDIPEKKILTDWMISKLKK
jgi:hypothetical protein